MSSSACEASHCSTMARPLLTWTVVSALPWKTIIGGSGCGTAAVRALDPAIAARAADVEFAAR
jgi:uncharacterized membrane protein YadS